MDAATSPPTSSTTTIDDLPDVILSKIFSTMIPDPRTRNSSALVCRKWLAVERSTRTSLSLRGNVRDLYLLPASFRSVTHLDLSLLSPWGHPLLSSSNHLLAHCIAAAFPIVTHLTIYARHPSTLLTYLIPHWSPTLTHLTLVRWHQRPPGDGPPGSELFPALELCRRISSLDLSKFYCWTEDLPAALDAYPEAGPRLTCLDLLNPSFAEGFKSNEIESIVTSCPNLLEFRVACTFDSRYIGFVGDDALLSISTNCRQLRILHLADISGAGVDAEAEEDGEGEEAGFSLPGLIEFFRGLEHVEELGLDVCKNVSSSWVALETLATKCPQLKTLKLGRFQKLCRAVESHLDGLAVCKGLVSLSIKDSVDLTDLGLIAIGRGCSRLEKFEVSGCKEITVRGLRTVACLLKRSLVEVRVSRCRNVGAVEAVRAVEPICDRIKRLHIDCVWNGDKGGGGEQQPVQVEEEANGIFPFDLNAIGDWSGENHQQQGGGVGEGTERSLLEDANDGRRTKRQRFSFEDEERMLQQLRNNHTSASASNGLTRNGGGEEEGFQLWAQDDEGYVDKFNRPKQWTRLEFLSLWLSVGELITPLTSPAMGLEDCPKLSEIHIKVEGDCRERPCPTRQTFGLSLLAQYPSLSKMKLDLGDTTGYALTAPSGHMDLSLWERFYLSGIGDLIGLRELDYWPPQDREVNQRSLSLPAAGSLAQCGSLRKLFIHGTAHEHFMNFFLDIRNLRDAQLREDYYPAPENDMSTEMRVDSCCRFEDALNQRQIPD